MNESDVTQLSNSIKNAFIDALPVDLAMDIRNTIAAAYVPLCDSMAAAIRVFTEAAIDEAVSAATQAANIYVDEKLGEHMAASHSPDPNAGAVPPHTHSVSSQLWSHSLLWFLGVIGHDTEISIPVKLGGVTVGHAVTTPGDIVNTIIEHNATHPPVKLSLSGTAQ